MRTMYRHTLVFSSSWSRARQAEELDEWQTTAQKIAASYAPPPCALYKMGHEYNVHNCEFRLLPLSINKETTTLERRQLCFQIAHSELGKREN